MAIETKDLVIDKRKKNSIKEQVISSILHFSQSTLFDEKRILPHPIDVASHYQIDADTVMLAYNELIARNLLILTNGNYSIQPFVFSAYFYKKIVSIYDQIKTAGFEPSFTIIQSKQGRNQLVGFDHHQFELSDYYYSKRLFYASGVPVIVYESYLNTSLFEFNQIDFNLPIYQQLHDRFDITLFYSTRRIKAVLLSNEVCQLLNVPSCSVGMQVTAETYDEKNQLIEVLVGYSTNYYQIRY